MVRFPSWVFRGLYRLINRLDKEKQVIFMNYGFSTHGDDLTLAPDEEKNRYPIQLYRHMTDKTDLSGKCVVEVGCGRGGGLSYIACNYKASSLVGIDIEKTAVEFASKQYQNPKLTFLRGNAEKIPMPDNSCDVVLNVESSHRYLSFDKFISEVARILKPDGIFLFTDFRHSHEWELIKNLMSSAGLENHSENDITDNIVLSLQKDTERRLSLVHNFAPRILHKGIENFSGCEGSQTYRYFVERIFEYKSFFFVNRKMRIA